MKQLANGELQIDSAIEARLTSHAIAIGRGDPNDRPYLVHRHALVETLNEVEFFRREQEFGKLTVRAATADEAKKGFEHVASGKAEADPLTPETAGMLLEIINRQKLQDEVTVELSEQLRVDEQAPFTLTLIQGGDTEARPPAPAAA